MEIIIDNAPLPSRRVTLRDKITDLTPGQSLCAPDASLNAFRVTVTRVKNEFPDRDFTTRKTREGPRVWRLS